MAKKAKKATKKICRCFGKKGFAKCRKGMKKRCFTVKIKRAKRGK